MEGYAKIQKYLLDEKVNYNYKLYAGFYLYQG